MIFPGRARACFLITEGRRNSSRPALCLEMDCSIYCLRGPLEGIGEEGARGVIKPSNVWWRGRFRRKLLRLGVPPERLHKRQQSDATEAEYGICREGGGIPMRLNRPALPSRRVPNRDIQERHISGKLGGSPLRLDDIHEHGRAGTEH